MLMLHRRKPISLLLAIVMLLSTLAAGPMVPFGRDNAVWAAPGQEPAGEFVRIKNKWTGHYLYEDESGIVRYGFTSATDASSHWAIEEGTNGSGSKSIRNRATGQYISAADIAGRTSALTTASAAEGSDTAWIVEPAVNRADQFTIRSAKFTGGTYFIHEEDQLGYAQVSGDIGAEWESPQWSFETAPTEQAVRIYNKYRQAYLYEVTEEGEDKGKIAYGDIAHHDAASHWYVHEAADNGDGSATVELRNALTNHVIRQGTHWAAIAGKTWEAKVLEEAVSYFTKRLEKLNPIIKKLKSKKIFFAHPDLDLSIRTDVGTIIGKSQQEIYVYDGTSLVKTVGTGFLNGGVSDTHSYHLHDFIKAVDLEFLYKGIKHTEESFALVLTQMQSRVEKNRNLLESITDV